MSTTTVANAMEKERQKYLRKAVKSVCEDAEYLLTIVRKANHPQGILRAVFVVDDMSNEPVLRRSGVISTSSLSEEFGGSLNGLLECCEPLRQFVTWITVEASDGTVLEHTTIIADTRSEEPAWEGAAHKPAAPQIVKIEKKKPRQLTAHEQKIETLRKRFGKDASVASSSSASPSQQRPGKEDLAVSKDFFEEVDAIFGDVSTSLTSKQDHSSEELRQHLSEIMGIALLTSKAAARIVASVDGAHHRLDKLHELALPLSQGPSPKEIFDKLAIKLDQMDSRMRLMEEHIAGLEVAQSRLRRATEQHLIDRATQTDVVDKVATHFTQTEQFDGQWSSEAYFNRSANPYQQMSPSPSSTAQLDFNRSEFHRQHWPPVADQPLSPAPQMASYNPGLNRSPQQQQQPIVEAVGGHRLDQYRSPPQLRPQFVAPPPSNPSVPLVEPQHSAPVRRTLPATHQERAVKAVPEPANSGATAVQNAFSSSFSPSQQWQHSQAQHGSSPMARQWQ